MSWSLILIILCLMLFPILSIGWFAVNLKRFIEAPSENRKSANLILPLAVSFMPMSFAVFVLFCIIGIFTGIIPLM